MDIVPNWTSFQIGHRCDHHATRHRIEMANECFIPLCVALRSGIKIFCSMKSESCHNVISRHFSKSSVNNDGDDDNDDENDDDDDDYGD